MTPEREYTDEEIREMSKKEFRKNFPSGWMELARYETLVLIIDALLESSPSREYTLEELGDEAGPSDKSIEGHLDKLVKFGVIERLDRHPDDRYSLNAHSPITQKLYELNITVQRVKEGDLPKSLASSPRKKILDDHGNRWDGGSGGSPTFEPSTIAASQ